MYTVKEVLKSKRFNSGMEIRDELISGEPFKCKDFKVRSAYNDQGYYIGDPKFARLLYRQGIKPERASIKSTICSIGFNKKQKRWYGWTNRSIISVGVGDRIDDSHPLSCIIAPGVVVENLDDARRLVVKFVQISI